MLAEHFEDTLRRPGPDNREVLPSLATTFLAPLSPVADAATMAWCAFGSPSQTAYFPIFLDGDLPSFFTEDNVVGDGFLHVPASLERAMRNRVELDKWQSGLDERTEDFCTQARRLKQQGNLSQLHRQATWFMAQIFDNPADERQAGLSRGSTPTEDMAYFAD
jgi:hypothetical protein